MKTVLGQCVKVMTMNRITVEMEDDQIDSIVSQELKRQIEYFEGSFEERSNGEGIAMYDSNPVKDVVYIQDYLSAFKTVLEYYCNSDD